MASPHVAGSAALLLAQDPTLTVAKLKSLLLFNGDVVAGPNGLVGKTFTGRRLNVGNSFAALAANDNIVPGAVTGFHIDSQSGRSFDLGWTASGNDGASGQASLYQLSLRMQSPARCCKMLCGSVVRTQR
jgi:subtilisin family serine protease